MEIIAHVMMLRCMSIFMLPSAPCGTAGSVNSLPVLVGVFGDTADETLTLVRKAQEAGDPSRVPGIQLARGHQLC